MAEKAKRSKDSGRIEKRGKEKSSKKDERIKAKAAVTAFSLLADENSVDATLSSLFAVKVCYSTCETTLCGEC